MLAFGLVRSISGGIAEIVVGESIVKLQADALALSVGDRVQLQKPPPQPANMPRAAFALPSQITILPGEVAEGLDPEFTVDDDVQPATAGDRESRPLFPTRS